MRPHKHLQCDRPWFWLQPIYLPRGGSSSALAPTNIMDIAQDQPAAAAKVAVAVAGEEEVAGRTSDGSVGWDGRRCVRAKTGGWLAGFLILLNQALTTLAVNGVGTNLVTFMTVVLRLDNADAANHVNNWAGTTYVFSIVGALIADSYWGRYKACVIFQLLFLAGLVELSISSHFFLSSSRQGGGPSKAPALVFYMSIYQIALGNGAYQPAVTTLGADQFDEEDAGEKKSKTAFYGYFFVANNLGSLLSVTLLTYMQDQGRWEAAFWISTAAAVLGLVLFAAGTLRFRHFLPSGNPIVSVCQVLVASLRKRRLKPPQRVQDLYELHGTHSTDGVRKTAHTPGYRCLDKAAVIQDSLLPGEQPSPWRLCSVTQVEHVKCILRLAPIWLCSIIYSTAYSQMASLFIEQAQAMDNGVSKFRIPPAGLGIFEIIGVTAFVFIYEFCIAKPLSKRSKEPTELQRMGIGLAISTAAMITAGLVEQQRLKHHSLSVLWQIPQYVLIGASEVFMYVTMTEFFNDQLPDGMRSLGSALSVASMSAGSYASSLLVTAVMAITGSKGDEAGWIPEDLNRGHVDWFFFLIALLNAIDLVAYVLLARRYRPAAPAPR